MIPATGGEENSGGPIQCGRDMDERRRAPPTSGVPAAITTTGAPAARKGKVTMKKIVALLLILAMLLPMAFAEEENTVESLYRWKYDEPVQISMLSLDRTALTYDASDPARKSAQENCWVDAYREYLNIELNMIIAEDEMALNARLNADMASGTLPDCMEVSKDMFYVLAENGVLADLTEAFDVYAVNMPHIYSILETGLEFMPLGVYDGEFVGLPQFNSFGAATRVLWVRQDWLDELNLEAPKTVDELIDVARAFMEAKIGGEETQGFGMTDACAGILEAYGAPQKVWMKQEDGSYVYGNVMVEEVSQGLLKMQQMYREGIVKEDFAVTNLLKEESANGVLGLYIGPGHNSANLLNQSMLNDPKANWVAYPIPTADGEPVLQQTNQAIERYWVVSKNCEHPEALFKMMEIEKWLIYEAPTKELSLQYNTSADGVRYSEAGRFRLYQSKDHDLSMFQQYREGLLNGTPVEDMPASLQEQYSQMKACYDSMMAGEEGYDRTSFGLMNVALYGYRICQEKLLGGWTIGYYNGPTTEAMSLYLDTINTALSNAMLKVIMGEDISVYEKAVEEWYQSGGQTITDEVNAYYQSLNA